MREKTVQEEHRKLRYITDKYKTQEMYFEVFEKHLFTLKYVPNSYRIQEMCNECVIDE